MKPACKPIIILAACLTSPLAQAHVNGLATGLLSGLTHPLTGLDHLAALILSGLLIGRLPRGRSLALAGLIGALGLGAEGGILLGAQAGVEYLVLLSLPVLFAFQWIRKVDQLKLAVTVMGLFMVAHGWAHGVEVHGLTQAFVSGFLLSSLFVAGVSASISHHMSSNAEQTHHLAPQGTLSTAERSHLA